MPRLLSSADIEAFKTRLCAVAERRFAEEGVAGVSMRQLAEELGCSPMTPYRYFRDKEDILAAVRAAAFDRFAAALEAAARTAADPVDQQRAVGDAYIRFALEQPHAYRLMFDMEQADGERYPELARAGARARATMGAGLRKLAERGELQGDPELMAYALWAAIHGLVMLRLAGKLPEAAGFDAVRAELARLLVAGMRAPAAPAEPAARPSPTARSRAR